MMVAKMIAKRLGLSLMAVILISLFLPAHLALATVTRVEIETTVEVNGGNTITLDSGASLSNIPLAIKNLPYLGASNGLGAFNFIYTWDKNVIIVDSVTAGNLPGNYMSFLGVPDNEAGILGISTMGLTGPYLSGNITIAYLAITAVGLAGESTSVNVTINSLGDKNGIPILASPRNAAVQLSWGTLQSIAVTPKPVLPTPPISLTLGQKLQFTANATYTGGTVNITADATWVSSNTSVATIQTKGEAKPGLATAVGGGTTVITASLVDPVTGLKRSPGVTVVVTTVEVNGGNPITLDATTSRSGIPLAIKNLPYLGASNGLGAFNFVYRWNPNVINVDTVTAGNLPGNYMTFLGVPDNEAGVLGISTMGLTGPYLSGNITIAYLAITAVGLAGESTSVNVTINSLGDKNGIPIPATPRNAAVQLSWGTLQSIAVTPKPVLPTPPISLTLGQKLQFTANGTYTGGTVNITADATWVSSNTSVVTIQTKGEVKPGLATAVGGGTTVITASLVDPVTGLKRSPGVTVVVTTVEVNGGHTITLDATTSRSGIPLAIKNLPYLGASNGLGAFNFIYTWDKNVIIVDSVTAGNLPGNYMSFLGVPDNEAGILGISTMGLTGPYLSGNITIAYLAITAVGSPGDSTSVNVTINSLGDKNGIPIPATPRNAPVQLSWGTLQSIKVTPPAPISLALKQKLQFTANATYTGGTVNITADATWVSSNPGVATIQTKGEAKPGLATAVAVGTTVITASLGGIDSTPPVTLMVTTGDVDHVLLSPKTDTITADQTKAYTAEAFNVYGGKWNITTGSTFNITAGAGGSWVNNVYTAQKAGTWTVTGKHTASGKTDTATLMVTSGALDHIVLSPDIITITAGNSQSYPVEAFDKHNNSLGYVYANTTFAITSGAGGSWALNVYTAQKAGTWTVTGTHISGKTDTAILIVKPGPVEHIVLSPDMASITTDETKTYSVAAFDAYTNSWYVTANCTFAIEAGAGGNWIGPYNNVYDAQNVGTWIVTAIHNLGSTPSGKTDNATLTVTGGAIVRIVVSPETKTITADNTTAYTVEAYDADFQHWAVTTETTFSINTTAGGSWVNNVYTAQKAGTWTVKGTHTPTGWTDTATLIVTPGALNYIVVSPDTITITAGNSQTYTVEAFDQRNNSRGDVTAGTTFSINATAGGSWSGTYNNVYTAGKASPPGIPWTVKGTHTSGKFDTATLKVNVAAIVSIVLSPATATITADETKAYTVAALDAYTNSWDVTAGTTFNITAGAGGSWSGTYKNVYTAGKASPPGIPWIVTGNHTATGKTDIGTATLTVTVGVLHHIVVSPATANITAGYTTFEKWGYDFSAEGFDQRNNTRGIITTTCTWSSSDTRFASVETTGQANPGRAKGNIPGVVTITATRGLISGKATLTVTAAELKSIAVTPAGAVITHLGTQQFRAIGIYSDGLIVDITASANWTSVDKSVATIQTKGQAKPGLATSVAPGPTVITASLVDPVAGLKTSPGVTLTVTDATLEELEVTPDPAPATVVAGLTKQFKAMGHYSDSLPGVFDVNRTNFVTWSSNNTAVARINAAGLATSYSVDTTVTVLITATSSNSTGDVISSTTLTVNPAVLKSIVVTPVTPTITFVSGPPGTTPPLQFTATGIKTDGSTVSLTNTANWTSSNLGVAAKPVAGLVTAKDDGTTTIIATDLATATSGNTTLTVLPDKVAPVVKLTSPTDGLVLTTTNLTVTGSVNDVNADVTIIVNSGAPIPATKGEFSKLVTSADGLNVGSNTVLVRAVDPDGNKGTSGTRTVVVNPLKPTITITAPAEGTITSSPTLPVSVTIVGATSATLRVNGVVVPTVSGNFTKSITLTKEGTNIIVASGYATGAPTTDAYLGTSGVRTVMWDKTPPIVIINSPSSGSIVNTSGIEVSGTVNDPGVSTANLTVNNIWRLIPVVGGTFSQEVSLNEGSNTITVKATDKALNTSLPVSVTIIRDATTPRVTITAPKNNLLTNVAAVKVTGTVYDPWISGATLIVNGSSQPIDIAPDGSFSKMVPLTPGIVNKIEVTAIDKALNIGRSGVVNVTVDQTPPKITIGLSDPTDSMLITVISDETLIEKPVVSVNATAITMTPIDINQWTGVFEPIPDGQYNVTANATGIAGNRATARATFSKQTVTFTVDEVREVRTETTTLEITTTADVTDASVSLTSTLGNPAGNVDNPEGAETEAGLFIEIVASPELRDNLESIDIRVDYDQADIEARGIVEASLKLYLWSVTTGQWDPVPGSAANTTANYVYGTVTHLSKYGAFGTIIVTLPTLPTWVAGEVIVTEPGIIDVSGVVTSTGVFTIDVAAKSGDTKVKLAIAKGTIGKTQIDTPLSRLTITVVKEPPAPPKDASFVALTYDLGPDGATFAPPITLTFTYNPAEIPAGVSEQDLVIAMWDKSSGKWVVLEGGIVNTATHTITVPISHFTAFTIIAPAPEEEVVPPEEEVVPPEEEVVPPEEEVLPPEEEVLPPEEEVVPPEEEVVPPEEEVLPPEEEVPAPIAWWVWLIVGLVVVTVIGVVIWLVLRRRTAQV